MFLYCIRHAQTDATTQVPYHLPPGPALTERGRAQAAALIPLLSGVGLERVVSSPLRRCVMTAAPLARALALPVVVDGDLREGQPDEAPGDITLRMLRAALAHTDVRVVALVSHAAPLTQFLRVLTHDEVRLPAQDRRGNHLSEGMVWAVYNLQGRWNARHLPPGGISC